MSAPAKDEAPIEASGEASGESAGRSEYRSNVRESTNPHREKSRAPTDIVWVQRIESKPNDWFKCEVTEVSEDPITKKALYRVKLVDGGAPGTLFQEGKWLLPDRLRDEDDRQRPCKP